MAVAVSTGLYRRALPYPGGVAIVTGYRPRSGLRWVVWDESETTLGDVADLIGWVPPRDGSELLVRLSDGIMQRCRPGWVVYVEGGVVGVASARVASRWVRGAA